MGTEPQAKGADSQQLEYEKEGLVLEEDICYGIESERQTMDIIYPAARRTPMPAVIWIHGGSWSFEDLDKRYRPERELRQLAKLGFLVASIEYRLCQHAPFPAQIADCKCAVRYLRANAAKYAIDPGKIGAWGESAGGHLASLLGAAGGVAEFEGGGGHPEQSSRVQAVCAWYAPHDMLKQALIEQNTEGSVFYRLFGGNAAEKRDLIWAASPMKYAKDQLPPYLIMHGTADKLVPFRQSQDFYDALTAAGNVAELLPVPGQPHGFFHGQEYYDAIFTFFQKYLADGAPAV